MNNNITISDQDIEYALECCSKEYMYIDEMYRNGFYDGVKYILSILNKDNSK